MPVSVRKAIVGAAFAILAPEGRYIQFTYSKRAWRRHHPPGFRLDATRRVWLNVPPAEVLPFTRLETHHSALVSA